MSGGHATTSHHLHVPGRSPIHRLAPEAKVIGVVLFVVAVALTPRRAVGAFAVDAAVVAMVIAAARLSLLVVLTRLAVIVPFLLFAVFVPFVAGGEQTTVFGVSLSVEGLWAMSNIMVKATLGATASIVLSATTSIPDILRGLARLRVPTVVVAIIGFMFRYLDLLSDQLRRMRRAMTARGHDPRWLWQAKPIATSAGALFVRSYERGERIHAAMVARGYTGSMPTLDDRRPGVSERMWALGPGLVATAALVVAVAT